jgi:tellurite resistance protein TehA-like permease
MPRLAAMPPGYFALVMATGIVSIASYFLGLRLPGLVLLLLNAVQYVALIVFTILRLIRYRSEFVADLVNPSKCITFLTASAGTFILGSQFVILLDLSSVGAALWIGGIVLWTVFVSAFFTVVISGESKPTVPEGISGATLILVVATEGICVLGTLLSTAPGWREWVLFVSLGCLCGGRDPLSDPHHSYSVSLDVLSVGSEHFHAFVLDQHGSVGDYHAGGFQIDS